MEGKNEKNMQSISDIVSQGIDVTAYGRQTDHPSAQKFI